uniref:tRNA-t(6)A37 methylthiotransferase n=1 Tax=Pristionchus pacificus TaxID=54126 RepID=A0A8R1V2M4_PRIPA
MSGILAHAGYSVVREAEAADVWVLNSCTVKTPSEDQAFNLVRMAKEKGKRVVMAGCVSQADPSAEWLQDVSIVGVKQIDQVEEAVKGSLEGKSVRILTRNRPHAPLDLPKIRKNPLVEVLAISTGCLNQCTYCKTKAARGDLKSISLEDLVARAKKAFEEGVKELWLTSEDLGAWGRDIGLVIPDLLHALVEVIPEGCRMRLGMTNPPYIMDHLHEIAEILLHPRVYRFLHIPIQSASDEVLRHMKREYTVVDFCKAVDYLLERVPDLYIATDFICAYPTESKKDFEESMALVRRYHFPSLFINQYYPRSGTPAAALPRVDAKEAKARTAEMSAYFRGYSRFDDTRVGKEETVLICEEAADGVHLVGHSSSYEQILVPRRCGMGMERRVRITSVGKFHMMAEPVEDIPEIKEEEESTMESTKMAQSRLEVIPTNGVEEGLADDVIVDNRSISARQLALITVIVLVLAVVLKKLMQVLMRD